MGSFEDAKRIFTEANAAISSFVMVEIDAGLTYCRLANGPRTVRAVTVPCNMLRMPTGLEHIAAKFRKLESELGQEQPPANA